jgi:hypothetical protein
MMTQEYGPETDRLKFIEKRDGVEAAVEFAQDTLRTYRRFVLSKRILRPSQVSTEDAKSSTACATRRPVVHAMSAAHRHNFISSYLAFKRYVALRQSNSGD